jgi:hypothetical protein
MAKDQKIPHEVNGITIEQRVSDGFLNQYFGHFSKPARSITVE